MLLKNTVGYNLGGVNGALGPSIGLIPERGHYIDSTSKDLKLYRMSEESIIMTDSAGRTDREDKWSSFLFHMQE